MKKIIALSFFFASPSFAQTEMLNTVNMINNTMLMAAAEEQNQQQAQVAAPVVVNIQYQSDGTAVVTSSSPNVTIQSQPQEQEPIKTTAPTDNHLVENVLSLVLGLFVGCIVTKIFSRK